MSDIEEEVQARLRIFGKIKPIWNLSDSTEAIPEKIRHDGELWQWEKRTLLNQLYDLTVANPHQEGLKEFQTALKERYAERMKAGDSEEGVQERGLDYSGLYIARYSMTVNREGKQKASVTNHDLEGNGTDSLDPDDFTSPKRKRTHQLSHEDEDSEEGVFETETPRKRRRNDRGKPRSRERTEDDDDDFIEPSVEDAADDPSSEDGRIPGENTDSVGHPSVDDQQMQRKKITEEIKKDWGPGGVNLALPENSWYKLRGDSTCPRAINDLVLDISTLRLFLQLAGLEPSPEGSARMEVRRKEKWQARRQSRGALSVGTDKKEKEPNIRRTSGHSSPK